MRFVDLDHLAVDSGWQTRATATLSAARGKPAGKARSDYINGKATLWKELKPALEKLSNKKCWYCEAKENRSDRHVDHFRPKNSVRGVSHGGYWWLAFSPDNYRLCCTFCNCERKDRESGEAGGKSDYFPLVDETKRVPDEAHDANRQYELPTLLDPCRRADIGLISFRDDGRAVPRHGKNAQPGAFLRADESIKFYHLNECELKEGRQAVYNSVKEQIEEGDFHFCQALKGDVHAERGLASAMRELAAMISPSAEFSAFAETMIRGLRAPNRPWLDDLHLQVQR